MGRNVLCVAPHPDDETLGCGGTLLRHINDGDEVSWLIMTSISEELGFSKKKINDRAEEIDKVKLSYGFSLVEKADFITTKLDTYPKSDLISVVSNMINTVQPEIIYLPFRNDVHSDHKIVFDVVASCTKSFRYPCIKHVLAYETLSETEFSIQPSNSCCFQPNFWVDISGFLDRKIEIMSIYEGETKNHPFPRSEKNLRALATFRGATAGVFAAESFVSLKQII